MTGRSSVTNHHFQPADLENDVVEMLAVSEAAMIDLVVELLCQRDSYRLLAQQLLHTLHGAIRERDQINLRCQRLCQDYSRLRKRGRQP